MAPAYTLYTPQGSFRAFAPLIAAEFNAIDVYVETKGLETIAGSKSPTGKLPVLETPRGTLSLSIQDLEVRSSGFLVILDR